MLKKSLLLLHLLLVSLSGASCLNEPSTSQIQSKVNTKTNFKIQQPSDEAKIDDKNITFQVSDTKLESLLAQPLPDVVFVFSCQNNETKETVCNQDYFKLNFPITSNNILEDYWREAIKFRYETVIKKNELNAQSYYNKTIEFSNISESVSESLQKVYVDAPKGKRQISYNESGEIIGFLNKKSSNLIQQAKTVDAWKF